MCVRVNPADDLVRTTQEAERRLCHTVPVVVEKEHLAKISLSPPMISKDRQFSSKKMMFDVLHHKTLRGFRCNPLKVYCLLTEIEIGVS